MAQDSINNSGLETVLCYTGTELDNIVYGLGIALDIIKITR